MAHRLAGFGLLLGFAVACGGGDDTPAEVDISRAGSPGSAGKAGSGEIAGSGVAGAAGQGTAGGALAGTAGVAGAGQGGSGVAGQGGSGLSGSSGQGGVSGSSGESGAGGASGAAGQGEAGQGGEAGSSGGSGQGGAAQGGGGSGQGGSSAGQGGGGQGGSFPPSTGNLGWIGGACESDADCNVEGGKCLKDGFPNGYCTAPCDLFCPDRSEPGDTTTFCVDGSPVGMGEGACLSRCDLGVFPGTGCAPGYECVERNRYADPGSVEDVCLPLKPPGPCAISEDLILPLNYPDAGVVWVPAEARCGGAFDLVVMLHGINPSSNATPSLGGGRRLEVLVRGQIDGGQVRPVILAEPVHFQGSSTQLYGAEFSPEAHLDQVLALLDPLKISLASLSYTGHSGAGCDAQNGLYKVLNRYSSLIPAYAPVMPLWGLEDICYESSYHWQAPLSVLTPTPTAIVNVYSVQGNPAAFEQGLLPDAEGMPCNSTLYTNCIRSPARPWCSYRTRADAGISHDNNPYFFVREVFPQVFSPNSSKTPCFP